MQGWHHRSSTDIALRLTGVGLCGISWLAIQRLAAMRLPMPPGAPGAIAIALAAIGFVCASLGVALLSVGHHIFDPVTIGARWRSNDRDWARRSGNGAEEIAAGGHHLDKPIHEAGYGSSGPNIAVDRQPEAAFDPDFRP